MPVNVTQGSRPAWASVNAVPEPPFMWVRVAEDGDDIRVAAVLWNSDDDRTDYRIYTPGRFRGDGAGVARADLPADLAAALDRVIFPDEDEDEDEDEYDDDEAPWTCPDCGDETTPCGCGRDLCADCCAGRGRSDGHGFDNPQLRDAHEVTFFPDKAARGAPRRLVSVEIEVSGVRDYDPIEGWRAQWRAATHEDGSVPPPGFEINTSPAAGRQFLVQMDQLSDAFDAARAETSVRCGVHVHVDARDFRWGDMARALAVWAWSEHAWFGLIPGTRRGSQWCERLPATPPLSEGYDAKREVLRLTDGVYEGVHFNKPRRETYLPWADPHTRQGRIGVCYGDECETTYAVRRNLTDAARTRLRAEVVAANPGAPGWLVDERWVRVGEEFNRQLQACPLPYTRRDLGQCDHDLAIENDRVRYARDLAAYHRFKRTGVRPYAWRTKPARKNSYGYDNTSGTRYRAFNIKAWYKHGTVEFRMHQASIDIHGEIVPWAVLCRAFMHRVRGMTNDEAEVLVSGGTNPRDWLIGLLADDPDSARKIAARWGRYGGAPYRFEQPELPLRAAM